MLPWIWHRRGRISKGSAAVAALVLIAGCGATVAKPAKTSPTTTVVHSSSPKLIPITIAKAVNTISFTTANIAAQEGFFRQQGIQPKIITLSGSSAANAALVGGSVQFTLADSTPLALARSHGVPLLAVVGIDHGNPVQLMVSTKWTKEHHLSTTQSLDTRIKGLTGMTFAQIGPTDMALLKLLLRQAHVNFHSIKVVSLGSGAEAATALEHGAIDAFGISPPTSFQVAAQGYAIDLVNYETVPGQRNIEFDLVNTTAQYAKAHPRIVTKVATAFAEAVNFVRQHPHQTLKIEEQLFPSISASVLQHTIALIKWNPNGLQSSAYWAKADALINILHVIKHGQFHAVKGVDWTNQYIDRTELSD